MLKPWASVKKLLEYMSHGGLYLAATANQITECRKFMELRKGQRR